MSCLETFFSIGRHETLKFPFSYTGYFSKQNDFSCTVNFLMSFIYVVTTVHNTFGKKKTLAK